MRSPAQDQEDQHLSAEASAQAEQAAA